jgi:hypothetical protein
MTDTAEIETAVLEARTTLAELFRRSGVSPNAFYVARRKGRPLRPLTKARLWDTIKVLRNDK